MKKSVFPILLLLLFGLMMPFASAQSWNHSFSFQIDYAHLPQNSKLGTALNFVADNNGVSVYSLHLNLSYLAQLTLSDSKAGIPVLRYKVTLQKVSGSTRFHDFDIDTLLAPSGIEAVIRVYQHQKLLDSLNQFLTLNNEQVLLPVSGKAPLSSLYITFDIVRLIYTEADYQKFTRVSNEINHYYGYRRIIKDLPDILLKTNDIHPDATVLFYNSVALTRLAGHIRAHHFSTELHLNKKDPLHFRRAFAAMLRKKTRMETLSEEAVNSGKLVPAMERVTFAGLYASLSMKAIELSKQYQPYISGSFREYARIFPQGEELNIVAQASRYYNRTENPGQATVAGEIYRNFLEAASLYSRQQAYVASLDMLDNAACFEENFAAVNRIAEFDSLLTAARDGLATSYLKVARIAFQHHNTKLANQYLEKAFGSLQAHKKLVAAVTHPVCYRQFSEGMRQMASDEAENLRFRQAIYYLDKSDEACPGNAETNSLRQDVCRKMFDQELLALEGLLQDNSVRVVYDSLLVFSNLYPKLCHDSLALKHDARVQKLTSEVFQLLLEQSKRFWEKEEVLETMQDLNFAGNLQYRFSLPPSPELDSLLKQTTVSYILAIAETANLEVWRKNFRKADSIYKVCLALGYRYKVEDNQVIDEKLQALAKKINIDGCRWHLEQVGILLKKAGGDIRNYRVDDAKSLYLKARQYYGQTLPCRKNADRTDSLLAAYKNFFQFAEGYHNLTEQLFQSGFQAVLPRYARLDSLYHHQHLERFGFPYNGLYDFVRKQHTDRLTLAAVEYYLQQKSFETAFRFLKLLEHPELTKREQRSIATGFVQQNRIPPQEILQNPAFATFAKAYAKALAEKK